jgi:monoamine oxidase
MEEVIVIGAGAAGLSAAECLATEGVSVTVLEARNRVGGRIFTWERSVSGFPVELGAEFIHGRKNDVWDLVHSGGLRTHKVPDRHWAFAGNRLTAINAYWDRLARVTKKIGAVPDEDQDVMSWLNEGHGLSNDLRQMALDFVENFHAAPGERMSLAALASGAKASELEEGEFAFRIHSGYSAINGLLLGRALARNTRLYLSAPVRAVRWEPGAVEVETQTPAGIRLLHASRAVITLPLGVLKSGQNAVQFEPALVEKEKAIRGLKMGHVVKIAMLFRSPFWPVENFGFIHSDDEWLPVWWADERGPLLTGWAGGPRAEWLGQEDEGSIRAEAFRALSRIFGVEQGRIEDLLVDGWRHDWMHDRFALGAYSYTPVGGVELPHQLGEPVAETLFFAGEATAPSGEQGTVHAAISSGRLAANAVLETLRTPHRAHQLTGC